MTPFAALEKSAAPGTIRNFLHGIVKAPVESYRNLAGALLGGPRIQHELSNNRAYTSGNLVGALGLSSATSYELHKKLLEPSMLEDARREIMDKLRADPEGARIAERILGGAPPPKADTGVIEKLTHMFKGPEQTP